MYQLQSKRPAIAMIELIFALVIMAIVMMSAPMLISTASKSGYVTMQQESISQAAAQINMILSYSWDENDTNESYAAPLLGVSSVGDSELAASAHDPSRRLGTPKESPHSFVRDDGVELNASVATSFGAGNDDAGTETENDDMDDFSGSVTTLQLVESSSADIIDNSISMSTTLNYISDDVVDYNASDITYNLNTASSTDTTNIKHIRVTLTSTSDVDELNKTIVLHAFSCNIGAYVPEEREVN